MPWLEPDVCDRLRELAAEGVTDVVVVPLGFVSDHIEVLYDLDDEARAVADELGMTMVRAATVGTHPRFVAGIRELIAERLDADAGRPALGAGRPEPRRVPRGLLPARHRPPEPLGRGRGRSLSQPPASSAATTSGRIRTRSAGSFTGRNRPCGPLRGTSR